ncbi:MAG: class I SAM-dependent methyltransferase [Alphaproteobacteria bacterium]
MAENNVPQSIEAAEWAGQMGAKWLAHLDQFEGMIAGVGSAVIAEAKFKPGERVIDIGCGGGATSMEIARIVGPNGSVTGLDISPALARHCESRARKAGLSNTRFIAGDAATTKIGDANFDRLFSRFGVMFFADSKAAFAHMHGFLKPGGGLNFACWGPPPENTWMQEIAAVSQRILPAPPPMPPAPSEPGAMPGPFAFADPDYVRGILQSAGFTDINIKPWRGHLHFGGRDGNPEEAARFIMEAMPMGAALQDQPAEKQRQARAELTEAFARHKGPSGLNLQGVCWFVSARA